VSSSARPSVSASLGEVVSEGGAEEVGCLRREEGRAGMAG